MLLNGLWIMIAFAVGVLWLIALSFWLYRTTSHYSRLIRIADKGDLKDLLEKILADRQSTEVNLKKIEGLIQNLEKRSQYHFQKLGFVRFNPFSETGGDQSFTLAFLDGKDNGIVILSLHNREGTRIYAKPVKEGKSQYELSKEEVKAIQEAQKVNTK